MNPKYDINASDEDNDFERTHNELAAYVRGSQERHAGATRLIWEQKVMRRIKGLEDRVKALEAGQHDTAEIAIIAQREIGPARKFVEAVIHWRKKIVGWAVAAAVVALVSWLMAKQGIKP